MYLCRVITPFGNFKEGEEIILSLREMKENFDKIKILKKYDKINMVIK